jgi:ribosome maturation protein SDO1
MQPQTYTHEKIHLNLARLKKGGKNFEVIIEDVDKALELKSGSKVDISDIVNGDLIFDNAHKATKASEEDIKEFLGTENHSDAAKVIIQKGDIQLTGDQRKRLLEVKTQKIINYIQRNACDPKTRLPLPKQRIELAMKEAKVHVDPADKLDFQIEKIISKLQPILAMSFEKLKLRIIIPARYAGHAYSAVKGKFKPHAEDWKSDGSVQVDVEIVAGDRDDLFSLLNKLTNGEVNIEELK